MASGNAPYGGPSFASEFDIMAGIACETGSMATAAGGTSAGGNFASMFGILAAIDCNVCETVDGLGAASCTPGFDGEMGLLYSIACNTRALVDAVGGTQVGGSYEYNTVLLWNQINCNFRATALATGTGAPGGYSGDSVWNLMQSIYCAVVQIVANGFGGGEDFVVTSPGGDQVTTDLGVNVVVSP